MFSMLNRSNLRTSACPGVHNELNDRNYLLVRKSKAKGNKEGGMSSVFYNFGGEAGIRTLGRLPFNGFQDRRFRPLSHLSDRAEYYLKLYLFAMIFKAKIY